MDWRFVRSENNKLTYLQCIRGTWSQVTLHLPDSGQRRRPKLRVHLLPRLVQPTGMGMEVELNWQYSLIIRFAVHSQQHSLPENDAQSPGLFLLRLFAHSHPYVHSAWGPMELRLLPEWFQSCGGSASRSCPSRSRLDAKESKRFLSFQFRFQNNAEEGSSTPVTLDRGTRGIGPSKE